MTRTRKGPHGRVDGTVLVTGAGSGIGEATSLAFATRGAQVLCADIDGDKAARTADRCRSVGASEAASFTVDVSDRDAMAQLAKEVDGTHGALDVLVNNAGVGMSGRFLDVSMDDWEWILGINLNGVIHGCHFFAPAMVAQGRGHIVNLSSGLGYTPRATENAYVTTKAAVLALSRSMRADLGPLGVGVTAICPGVIATPIVTTTRFAGEADAQQRQQQAIKLFKRIGHPPELVARKIVEAVEKDRPVVPVGIEASAGWFLNRVLPLRLGDRFNRVSVDGV